MVGTVVDYSGYSSSARYVKISSGEKIFEVYPLIFLKDIKMGMQVEFNVDQNICKPLNS